MQNRTRTFGVKRNVLNAFHKLMLLTILHSSFIAPSQNLIIGYLNYKTPLSYKGYILNNEEAKKQTIHNNILSGNNPIAKSNSSVNNFGGSIFKNIRLSNENLNEHYSVSSDIISGTIGISKEKPLDDSTDNLFKVNLKNLPSSNSKVYLTYDLFGAQDYTAVSRSINNRLSTGGYVVKNQMGWTTQKEEIDPSWLKIGENKIMFGIPVEASYQYQIKNLKIEIDGTNLTKLPSALVVPNLTINYFKNNQIYIKGFLRNNTSNDIKVYFEDNLVSCDDGEFEGFLNITDVIKKRKFIIIKALDNRGILGQEIINLDNLIEADKIFPLEKAGDNVSRIFKANKSDFLQADGATVTLNDSALVVEKEISIKKLRSIDIAPMGSGMINVTKGGLAYRFLPDGIKFEKPVMLSLAYDERLIPKGYTSNDVKTFYFNTDSKSWVAVKRDTINKTERTILSKTNHFTDYINGIIQAPESPETAGFTSTMMNDIKAADPSSEMTIISPPEVSQKGDANISYPIKIPAGRKGMEPQLAVQYSNEGGNSWLGQGWNITIPAITIDTRWGVPILDSTNETEIYSLNGEQLMYPKVNGQDWMPNRHQEISGIYDTSPVQRTPDLQFTPRKQGSFALIIRLGNSPENYYWKVTGTDGIVSWYGGKTGVVDNSVIKNSEGKIVYWGLYLTEDVYSNNIKYIYENDPNYAGSGSASQANLAGGQLFQIKQIRYTGSRDKAGFYEVEFVAKLPRPDISINARLGVKQVEPYLLSSIYVRKRGDIGCIRKYDFQYNPIQSKFKKSQLISVAEIDKNNKEFYRHKFEYYDDLADGTGNDIYFSSGIEQSICFEDATTCPDRDGDGVCDADDKCPDVFGPIINKGCPVEFKKKQTEQSLKSPNKKGKNYHRFYQSLMNNYTFNFTGNYTFGNGNCPGLFNYDLGFSGYIPDFDSTGASLGSSKSHNVNVGGHVGVGIDFEWNGTTKNITLGAQYTHGWDNGKSFTSLIDINGDGLDDIVYKVATLTTNKIYWKKHTLTRTYNVNNEPIITHAFEAPKLITSINNDIREFYKSDGESSGWNFQVNFGFSGGGGFVGYESNKNHSRTNVYFTDANSDGLMDIEKDGRVYFNRTDTSTNNSPYFETESYNTENMLIEAAPVRVTLPPITEDLTTPNYDVVKVWEAPADGTIRIDNTIENTDPTKESIVTIEKEKATTAKCYTVSFPVPYSNVKKFIMGRGYTFDRISPVNISLDFKKLILNGTDYSTTPKLYITNGDMWGYRNDCLNYLQLTTGSGSAAAHITSPDFITRCNSFFNTIESYFPNSAFTINNYSTSQNACSGCCDNAIVDVAVLNFELLTQSINTMVYISEWTHNGGVLNGIYCPPATGNSSDGVTEWVRDVPYTVISNSGINTNIILNGINFPNSYILAEPTDFTSFQSYFQNQYPGSSVTLNVETNVVTITINDTIDDFTTIALTPINGSPSNIYNFTQIPCNQKTIEQSNRSFANIKDDWKEFRYTKAELEIIQKKELANKHWVNDEEILVDSGFEKEKFSLISKEIEQEIIYARKRAQKEAQEWLVDYYKKKEEKSSKNNIARITNTETCSYTPSDLCLLYGLKLNAANSNSPIIHNITTSSTECNPVGGDLTVRKGDRIYFRVHSISTGNPAVNWDPKITYINGVSASTIDQNGLKPYESHYSDGFILSREEPVIFPGDGTAQISWDNVNITDPTDAVTYEIIQRMQNGPVQSDTVLFTQTFNANISTTFTNPSSPINVTVNGTTASSVTQFIFRVHSTSNVNWKELEWHPKIIFNTSQPLWSTNGNMNVAQTKYPIVDYTIYKAYSCGSNYTTVAQTEIGSGTNVTISPHLPTSLFSSTDSGVLYLVVKRNGLLLGSRTINVTTTSILGVSDVSVSIPDPSPIAITGSGPIEIGYYTDDSKRVLYSPTDISLLKRIQNASTNVVTLSNGTTLPNTKINLYQRPLGLYGQMYRQWGQFMYNPATTNPGAAITSLGVNLLNENLLTITQAQATSIHDMILIPGSGSHSLNSTLTGLQNADVSTDAGASALSTSLEDMNQTLDIVNQYPFMMANPSREFDVVNGIYVDRWIAIHKEDYADATGYRGATLSQSFSFTYDSTISQASLNTGAVGIDKYTEGKGNSVSAGGSGGIFGASGTRSLGGASNLLTDYIDLNGDRYPDIVTENEVQFTKKTGGLYVPLTRSITGSMSTDNNGSTGFTASGTFGKSGKEESAAAGAQTYTSGGGLVSIGKPISCNFGKGNSSLGISGSYSQGENSTSRIWVDVNSDGLPDVLSRTVTPGGAIVSAQLNLGNNNFSESYNWGNFPLASGSSENIGGGIGFNYANASIEVGVSLGTSNSDSKETLIDINGDGMIDQFTAAGGVFNVRLNQGNRFYDTPISIGSLSYNNSASSFTLGLNGTYTASVIIPIFLPFIVIPLKVPDVSITASESDTTNRTKKTLTDFDSDGYPDFVEELNPGTVRVYSSRIRRTDMLKSVTNPLGGKFTIDYKVQPVTYDNPNPKWVMTDLVIEDGYDKVKDGRDTYKKHYIYENGRYDRREREFYGYETVKTQDYAMDDDDVPTTVYRTSVSKYHNHSYFLNGLLKESYILKGEDENAIYSRTENSYTILKLNELDNNIIAHPEVILPDNFDVGGREGRRTAIVLLTKTMNYLHELSPTALLTTEVDIKYNRKGRVKLYENKGNINDPSDNYVSKITYHNLANNILNIPASIEVYTGDNVSSANLIRKRTTNVNSGNGNIESIKALISTGVEAKTEMGYDDYGNLVRIKYPQSSNIYSNGQSMSYTYTYDIQYYKYVIKIEDAFGYSSSAMYDSNFDKVLKTIDLGGNEMEYKYDSFGRNTVIRAPKEIASGAKYTIAFQYFPLYTNVFESAYKDCVDEQLFTPFAITSHFDVQHPENDAIQTVSFIDGLGRPIQVKKDIQLNDGRPHNPDYKEHMSVSGKVHFDDFGRPTKQFHPYFEDKDCNLNYIVNEYESQFHSKTVYDELDRPTKTVDPDDNVSTMKYSIEEDGFGTMAIKTKSVVDQNGSESIVAETFEDVSGKVISTKNVGPSENLWTRFKYNAIGELMSYKDAENIVTRYGYDLLGRKLFVNHPDNGLTSFEYDKANNLVQLQTANLANDASLSAANRFIKYYYKFNRLKKIFYPDNPTTGAHNISNVRYRYGTVGNQTGRLVKQRDATGIQEFEYGNMGEMTHSTRKIVGPNIPTLTYDTYFNYDSFNRLQDMTYPDGEKVTYNYDLGGNLFRMTGEVNGAPYNYIKRIDYDYYEQRSYLLYGNKTETFYNYTPSMRRLDNLKVKTASGQDLFKNTYSYDKVGNVVNLVNSAVATSNGMGGNYEHTFAYDKLNRLNFAYGGFIGDQASQERLGNDYSSEYRLSMTYNKTHGIEQKSQQHSKNGVIFTPNNYTNDYQYYSGTHKLGKITETTTGNQENFTYDQNGNMITKTDETNLRQMLWDESNRLRVVNDLSGMQHYIYDASGERVLKANTSTEAVYENGTLVTNAVTINGYTTYPSAFIVTNQSGVYSKHYYAGSQRIVSEIGEQNATVLFGRQSLKTAEPNPADDDDDEDSFDDKKLQKAQIIDVQQLAEKVGRKNLSFKEFKPYTYEEIENRIKDDSGGLQMEITDPTLPPVVRRTPIYFYHPDHLGTSTALTDYNGNAYQFFLNLPFGETMAEQLPSSYYVTPYKFNGKELDDETGLYYYGARYYDPRISIWYSVDPLMEKYPNVNPYVYCLNNPFSLIDPDGKDPSDPDPPGNMLSRFRERSANWVDKNIRTPLSGWLDTNTRSIMEWTPERKAAQKKLMDEWGVTAEKEHFNAVMKDVGFLYGADMQFPAIMRAIKSLTNVKLEITSFEKIAFEGGGQIEKIKAGIKIIKEGGSKKAMEVYNSLLKSGYKSEKLEKGGYKLTKEGEDIYFRASTKSGAKGRLDTFNKKIDGKQVNVWYKE